MAAGRARPAIPNLDPNSLARFVDPLPLPAVARPTGHRAAPGSSGEPRAVLSRGRAGHHARNCTATCRRRRCGRTAAACPGPMFDTRSGEGLLIEWANELPSRHFLPIDHTLHGAETGIPEGRSVVHLHGAKTPPESDGYPEDWYGPGKSRTYYYPNEQDAGAALVPRSCDGHQPAEHLCRAFRPVRDPRRARARARLPAGQIRDSAGALRPRCRAPTAS